MSRSTLSAPVLSETDAAMLSAILAIGAEPAPANTDADDATRVALSRVAAAAAAVRTAEVAAAATVGAHRFSMAANIAAAIEAGATRLAIADAAGIHRNIVGHYARFPERLALTADALGISRNDAAHDAALVETVWTRQGRTGVKPFASFVDTLTAAAVGYADADAAERLAPAAFLIALLDGPALNTDAGPETDPDADADADGETDGETVAPIVAAADALTALVAAAETLTADDAAALSRLVAALEGRI